MLRASSVVVLVSVATLLAACGDGSTAPEGSDAGAFPADQVVAGQHDFLLTRRADSSTTSDALEVVRASVAEDGTVREDSERTILGAGRPLVEPVAIDTATGDWVIGARGCAAPDEPDVAACIQVPVLYVLTESGDLRDLGALEEVGGYSFALVGSLGGSVVLETVAGSATSPATTETTFFMVDLGDGAVSPVAWQPPERTVDPNAPAPTARSSCVAGDRLMVLDRASLPDGTSDVALTTVPLVGASATRAEPVTTPVALGAARVLHLICPGGTAVALSLDEAAGEIAATELLVAGGEEARTAMRLDGEPARVDFSAASATVHLGSGLTAEDSQQIDAGKEPPARNTLIGYAAGEWSRLPVRVSATDSTYLSGDGRSLLVTHLHDAIEGHRL